MDGINRLRLNPTKTELIWLARRLVHCSYGPLEIAGVWITPKSCVRDLGVMVDSDLSLMSHVNHLNSTCYYHIRQLRSIRRSLTVDTAHALARALIHSRLDYCNGVLAGLPKYQVSRQKRLSPPKIKKKCGSDFPPPNFQVW